MNKYNTKLGQLLSLIERPHGNQVLNLSVYYLFIELNFNHFTGFKVGISIKYSKKIVIFSKNVITHSMTIIISQKLISLGEA